MPKKTKKLKSVEVATNEGEFDKMLAKVAAGDPQLSFNIHNSTPTTAENDSGNGSRSSGSTKLSGRSGSSISNSSRNRFAPLQPNATITETAIIEAIDRGNIAQLRRWGQKGYRLKCAEPLIKCVFAGAIFEIYGCLVKDLGADVNWADSYGFTALIVAAQKGQVLVVQFLVMEFGADVHQVKQDGSTALFMAVQSGHLAMVQCLVRELGADVNQIVETGTPLGVAARMGNLDMVRCLVKDLGADVHQSSKNGSTPLLISALNGKVLLYDLWSKSLAQM
jgi:hypothetical protein